jgi:hypothetical protein
MNSDIYQCILLRTDAVDVPAMCLTNKTMCKICNRDFWLTKFNHSNIPLLYNTEPTNIKQWITSYTTIKNAMIAANKVLNIAKLEASNKHDIRIMTHNKSLIKLLPLSLQQEINNKDRLEEGYLYEFTITTCTKILLDVIDFSLHYILQVDMELNDIEIEKLLVNIIYHCPDVKIIDKEGNYYTPHDIIHSSYDNQITKKRLTFLDIIPKIF